MAEKVISPVDGNIWQVICGNFDENLKLIESAQHVTITCRAEEIHIHGDEAGVAVAAEAIETMIALARRGEGITAARCQYVLDMAADGQAGRVLEVADTGAVCVTASGKPVMAKGVGQQEYVRAIRSNTITFGIGPAGTGKTYLAVACAVAAFRAHTVSRMILTRPAVEAGEKLGFLPGDMQDKVDPYLRPLYDALFEILGAEAFNRQLERGAIEVAPLAYMRGRTLEDAFIILDEAQNTTNEQMKMFLTRLGENSRMVITGDPSQIDLPDKQKSGLVIAGSILKKIEGIAVCEFSARDVVRHRLVREIVRAYEGIS